MAEKPSRPERREARRTLRTQRRFSRRQWRRRWLQWKPLVIVVGVLAVAAVAVWLVWFSSVLAVKSVVVTGTSAISQRDVRDAAAIESGSPLVSVGLDKVHDRVAALAAVESVTVTRRWPDQVVIAVTERTPIAVIDLGGRLRGLDKDGVVFLSYKKAPANLPKVVSPAGTDARALREAAQVVRSLPPELAKITDHVEVATVDEVSLALTKDRTVQWGSSADSEQKAEVLAALLKHPAKVYDVSVPGQPTTK
ncbi:cell division protein FtsQ/DivIB [Nocardioides sp. Kera G14]|uniref:cell division protein FtsQ/DivIB n=1 Tax=Nocardioides sp. Kera G14 TaxID=2884264 RepID=UPI001D12D900|nr:FtsQ-type POTRA domain-containing protein [Nocardioides sp. Kera G14]UDY22485.1 FtsQ-type POTRA domain-containing protein [Nocardioides sp. Kera G14]